MEAIEYRYRLASAKVAKQTCPACGQRRHWQRYIDTETGNALPEQYGRCDNATKCGHQLNPYANGYAKAMRQQEQGERAMFPIAPKPKSRSKSQPLPEPIPWHVLESTLQPDDYEVNGFIQNLLCNVPFPMDTADVERVIALYYLGTVSEGFRSGAVTFPFIDHCGKVRAVQVKQFDSDNHTIGTGFLHTMMEKEFKDSGAPLPNWLAAYLLNDAKVTCLFGEHLLRKFPMNPVALVEAPKTAIYGTLYFGFPDSPDALLWLAVYNLSSLNLQKCRSLVGRDVFLFPDLSNEGRAFKLWSDKAVKIAEQMPSTRFTVSDLLEVRATIAQRQKGFDLADFLIVQDWRKFRKVCPELVEATETPKSVRSVESEQPEKHYFSAPIEQVAVEVVSPKGFTQRKQWDIAELEAELMGLTNVTEPVKLNSCSTITDLSAFIHSHLQTVKANNGNPVFLPYLHRLEALNSMMQPRVRSPHYAHEQKQHR